MPKFMKILSNLNELIYKRISKNISINNSRKNIEIKLIAPCNFK